MLKLLVFLAIFSEYYCRNVPLSRSAPKTINGTALSFNEIPQFIMLTFDNAVTNTNFETTYQKLYKINNTANNCPISATFFVSHDNTNYQLINDLWVKGHEIASHSITDKSITDYWKKADKLILKNEIDGQREIISKFAKIPKTFIKGYRAPFLQTSGDPTFKFLNENGFLYDSSMPTQEYSRPIPIYPYTLDNGFEQDCVIPPCPAYSYNYSGLWEVPLIDYWRKRVIIDGEPPRDSPCSMVDSCLPAPIDAADTENFFMTNFNSHYKNNKAPFPVFMEETWLSQDQARKEGYFNFIKNMTAKPDVFFVTIQEVIAWMEDPIPLDEYKSKACKRLPPDGKVTRCPYDPKVETTHSELCPPLKSDDNLIHYINVCGDCPTLYPRYGHTSGDD